MQTRVKESKQTQHAAKANQFRKVQDFTKWRNAKREDQKAKCPISSGVGYELDRIGGQLAVERSPA
jgi:hypothetical protein